MTEPTSSTSSDPIIPDGALAPAGPKITLFGNFTRLVIGAALTLRYRFKPEGFDNVPKTGPALLIANHVSYIDALAIAKHCPRPIRFVMAKSIYENPVLKPFLKLQGAIPIASAKEHPEALQKALDTISDALKNGELVCIFPEGKLTRDGNMNGFRQGTTKILERDPVPVVPIALMGLWGSVFTNRRQNAFGLLVRTFVKRRRVKLQVAPPLSPQEAMDAAHLENTVKTLRGPQHFNR